MSWRRPFIWTCDFCGHTEEKEGYGLPHGLRYVPATLREPTAKHICDQCFEKKVEEAKKEVASR